MHRSPLAAVRDGLPAYGVDGVLLARGDEHLGEDVPQASERLRFLSGFSGSAGMAIVLGDRAALFTDGRYQLQVRAEAGPEWECLHLLRQPPRDWLAALGRPGLRLGFDPRLLSCAALEALAGPWGDLVPLAANPVDAAWTDRPPPPATPVRVQPAALAGRSLAEKCALVAGMLRETGQDAVVLSDPASVCWLLNLRAADLEHTPALLAHALLRADGTATLFVDTARCDAAVRAHLRPSVAIRPPDALETALADLAGRTVRIDPVRTSAWFEQVLRRSGALPCRAPDPCLLPRARKTAAELEQFGLAHRHDGAALTRFLRWVARDGIGCTEHAVSERLLRLRLEGGGGCSGASFASIAAAGVNAAAMHYRPGAEGSAVLEAGTLFLIDSGGQYPGATTDVTRTVWLGPGVPPADRRRQSTRVLQGLIALSSAVFPDGTDGYRLDLLARLPLWRDGLEFDHGAGHGLGSSFAVHEWPSAFSPRPPGGPVHAGMVLTNEPGFYLPGSHGIRIENAMRVVARPGAAGFCGFETLTLAPIDRALIESSLLSSEERRWLDAYHARVAEALSPLLDPDDRAWLDAACAPQPAAPA